MKELLKTPTETFEAIKKAIDHYIEKDYCRKEEAEKIRQSIYVYINKRYEVEVPFLGEGKKYVCENGAKVELVEIRKFIAKTVEHEHLVEAGLNCTWDRFGRATEEGFNIIGEYNE